MQDGAQTLYGLDRAFAGRHFNLKPVHCVEERFLVPCDLAGQRVGGYIKLRVRSTDVNSCRGRPAAIIPQTDPDSRGRRRLNLCRCGRRGSSAQEQTSVEMRMPFHSVETSISLG